MCGPRFSCSSRQTVAGMVQLQQFSVSIRVSQDKRSMCAVTAINKSQALVSSAWHRIVAPYRHLHHHHQSPNEHRTFDRSTFRNSREFRASNSHIYHRWSHRQTDLCSGIVGLQPSLETMKFRRPLFYVHDFLTQCSNSNLFSADWTYVVGLALGTMNSNFLDEILILSTYAPEQHVLNVTGSTVNDFAFLSSLRTNHSFP